MLYEKPKFIRFFLLFVACSALPAAAQPSAKAAVFNVRDFGATGLKSDKAQPAIQKAVDACAAAGGGLVYVPPGGYSTGTVHLRSCVRFFIEAGATLYSIKDKAAFDKDALFYGEDLVNVTLEGRGTVDGQAAYVYRPKGDFQDDFIYPNQVEMEKIGRPLVRSFPKEDQFGKLVLLLRCKDVLITGLSFIDSPSWTMHLYGCERTVIDGVAIRSSLKDGVWADGIDPDGCKDLRISNCTIATGDDALVFYSMNWFGPALPCENITVTNCRLSSASSAVKFCDGNMNAIRNVTIDNCVITNSNRGIAFMDFDGGIVENIVLSNLTIDCVRYAWFWWGDGEPFHFNVKKRSEVHKNWKKEDDRPAGTIRNVTIANVIAHGQGASVCNGHPDSPLDGVTMDNVKLFIAHDPAAPYDKAVHALTFKQAKNLKLRNVEIIWDKPEYDRWASALALEDIEGLELDGFRGGSAPAGGTKAAPAVVLSQVDNAIVRHCKALPGTFVFLDIRGDRTRDIILIDNDFRRAEAAYRLGPEVRGGAVRESNNIRLPSRERTNKTLFPFF
ncbi:MAG: glycosyl hydrolase family 28 protein [Candidatus Aminicenantales bacterium]